MPNFHDLFPRIWPGAIPAFYLGFLNDMDFWLKFAGLVVILLQGALVFSKILTERAKRKEISEGKDVWENEPI